MQIICGYSPARAPSVHPRPSRMPASPGGLLTSGVWGAASRLKGAHYHHHITPLDKPCCCFGLCWLDRECRWSLTPLQPSGKGYYHTTFLRNRILKAYQEMRGFSLSYFPVNISTLIWFLPGKVKSKQRISVRTKSVSFRNNKRKCPA